MIRQPDNLSDDQIEPWHQAVEHFYRGYRMQMQGDLASAIRDYKLSLRLFPTAEASTFLGWVFAHVKLYAEAIEACQAAIELDPDFGNPYNDIGVYLIELERPGEAVTWLEQAIAAPRYSARVYAYHNLGRACELLGDWPRALDCYGAAVRQDATYGPARAALYRLLGRFN